LNYAFTGDDYMWRGRHYCHYFTLQELEQLFDTSKARIIERVGLEGLSTGDDEAVNIMAKTHPKAWKNWLDVHKNSCTNTTVVDISQHMMIIARKR
jgi:hypothetical protein